MGDNTSCEIYGKIFKRLAKMPTAEVKALARVFLYDSLAYDFGTSEMDADADLVKLGLCRRVHDTDNPGEKKSLYLTRKGTWNERP
jgi:hypothetical protein